MKKVAILGIAGLLLMSNLFTGCQAIKNANNAQTMGAIGAVVGGVAGGVIGNNVGKGGNAAVGAAIGAVVGGATGAIIGHKMDKQAREIEQSLPAADVERVGEGIRLVLNEDAVRFDTGKSTLTTQAKNNLEKLIKVFNEYKDTNIIIYGYTDNVGKVDYNLKLSERRATAVKSYLIAKGLVKERFSYKGMGMDDPIASNDTPAGRSKNRRVEFVITANDKMVQDAKKQAAN